jgi:hypothetical protein
MANRRNTFIAWMLINGLNLLLTFMVLGDVGAGATSASIADARNIEWFQAVVNVAAFICLASLVWQVLGEGPLLPPPPPPPPPYQDYGQPPQPGRP